MKLINYKMIIKEERNQTIESNNNKTLSIYFSDNVIKKSFKIIFHLDYNMYINNVEYKHIYKL